MIFIGSLFGLTALGILPDIDWDYFIRVGVLQLFLFLTFTVGFFATLFWVARTPNEAFGSQRA
jgi:hypothetical protein